MKLLDERTTLDDAAPQQARRGASSRTERPDPTDRVPALVAFGFAGAWILSIVWTAAVAPETEPDAPVSAFAVTMSGLYSLALLGSILELGARRRWGLLATVVGGLVMVTGSIVCGLGGHTGAWIWVQLGSGAALAGLGGVAYTRV